MAGGDGCEACGERTPAGARYCPVCGHPLGSIVLDLAKTDEIDVLGEPRSDPAGLRRVGVVFAVIALLGGLGAILFAGGGDPGGDNAGPRSALTPLPIDADLPTPPAPRPTASPMVPPIADPTPHAGAPLPAVSPARLPDLEATHLVAVGRSHAHFLDLATGTWKSHELPSRTEWVERVVQLGDSVVIAIERATWIADPDTGVRTLPSFDGQWLIGVGGGIAAVQGRGPGGEVVAMFDEEGVEQWSMDLPEQAWPQGVTSRGELVVQMGSQVAAVGPDGSRELARGIASGTLEGRWVLVWDCETIDDCTTELVSTEDGTRIPIPAERPWVYGELLGAETFFDDGSFETSFFVVHEGALHKLSDASLTMRRSAAAIDDSGHMLWGAEEGLVVQSLDGERWEIAMPGVQARAVGFVTATD